MNSILVYDIETDSLNIDKAKVKWFGAYSYLDDKYYLFDHTKNCQIKDLISKHKVLVGFNNKNYDNPILENYGIDFKYKILVDLYEISAPKGDNGYGLYNKNKLPQMGYKLKKYLMKSIIESLGLDESSKGDIDYNVFKKDNWSEEEIKEINKYLKQDIVLTKKLFEWYEEQFKPLKEMLPQKEQDKFTHIKASLSSLSYQIICHKTGLPVEWNDKKPITNKTFSGGHHIEPRWKSVKGNIIEIDFTSAYPHALMMGNLYSPSKKGWNGNGYYKIEGTYNNKEFGKIETSLRDIFLERLKAKKNGDKAKNLSYKIVINSLYGLTGNYKFKSLYNPTTAADCTSMVRTWMKKLAKTLEENGFSCLYGFTDSIFVKIPDGLDKKVLMFLVSRFIEEVKSNTSFPQETFDMGIEEELKFIWFYAKNCYLWVTNENQVKYKSTLLNTNTPKLIMNVFDSYIKSKIIKDLEINFTEKELLEQIKELLKKDISLVAEEHNVKPIEDYKVKTSLQYQISEKYSTGRHFLIPNIKGVGIGKAKSTKKKIGIRYCTEEEFNKSKLNYDDVDLSQLIKHLKPFIQKSQYNINQLKL